MSIFHGEVSVAKLAKRYISVKCTTQREVRNVCHSTYMVIGIAISHQGHSGNQVFSGMSTVREIEKREKEWNKETKRWSCRADWRSWRVSCVGKSGMPFKRMVTYVFTACIQHPRTHSCIVQWWLWPQSCPTKTFSLFLPHIVYPQIFTLSVLMSEVWSWSLVLTHHNTKYIMQTCL